MQFINGILRWLNTRRWHGIALLAVLLAAPFTGAPWWFYIVWAVGAALIFFEFQVSVTVRTMGRD